MIASASSAVASVRTSGVFETVTPRRRHASIRVYARDGEGPYATRLVVALDAPPEAETAARYRLGDASGSVAPGARVVAETDVCVTRGRYADVPLTASRSGTIAGVPLGPKPGRLRDVGVAVAGVQLSRAETGCS